MAVRKGSRTVTLASTRRGGSTTARSATRTRNGYRALLDRHASPARRSALAPLKDLTPETDCGPGARRWGRHPTINAHAYGLLHFAVCVTAVTDGARCCGQPVCAIRRAIRAARQREPVSDDVPEVAALADKDRAAAAAGPGATISAWLWAALGVKSASCAAKDIGQGAEVITVARGVTHRRGCRIDTPKSGKGRAAVVPPHIRADIEAHLDAHVLGDAEALSLSAPRGEVSPGRQRSFRGALQHRTEKHWAREVFRCARPTTPFAGTLRRGRVGNLVASMARLGRSTVIGQLCLYQRQIVGRDAEIAEARCRSWPKIRRHREPGVLPNQGDMTSLDRLDPDSTGDQAAVDDRVTVAMLRPRLVHTPLYTVWKSDASGTASVGNEGTEGAIHRRRNSHFSDVFRGVRVLPLRRC